MTAGVMPPNERPLVFVVRYTADDLFQALRHSGRIWIKPREAAYLAVTLAALALAVVSYQRYEPRWPRLVPVLWALWLFVAATPLLMPFYLRLSVRYVYRKLGGRILPTLVRFGHD